jgi:hypothetical protein
MQTYDNVCINIYFKATLDNLKYFEDGGSTHLRNFKKIYVTLHGVIFYKTTIFKISVCFLDPTSILLHVQPYNLSKYRDYAFSYDNGEYIVLCTLRIIQNDIILQKLLVLEKNYMRLERRLALCFHTKEIHTMENYNLCTEYPAALGK